MTKRKIPLTDPQNPDPAKKGRGWKVYLFFFLALCLLFLSPLPAYFVSLIPKSIIKSAIHPLYQNITLDETPGTLTAPKQYQATKPLPVLGRNTGICFTFSATDAKTQKPIAKIIAIDTDKTEYTLSDVSLSKRENPKDKDKNITTICQKFGTQDSLLPEAIQSVQIIPKKPLTPTKILWATRKDLR